MLLAPAGLEKRSDEKRYCEQLENGGDSDMPQHHNPMQLGLVLDGFTRDEMLFDVAQGGSSSRATTTGPQVLRRVTTPTNSEP